MSADDVRAMQAGCFLGEAGPAVGRADHVMSADEALMTLIDDAAQMAV